MISKIIFEYYHICISGIEDPESRMIHWDIEFQKTEKNKDEMLVGKKLNGEWL